MWLFNVVSGESKLYTVRNLCNIFGYTESEIKKIIAKNENIGTYYIFNRKVAGALKTKLMNETIIPGEVWKPIKGYEEYFISNKGRVKKNKIVIPYILNRNGNKMIFIRLRRKAYSLARLVYKNFIGDVTDDYIVYCKNRNYADCNVNNLILISKKERIKRNGTITKKMVQKIDINTKEVIEEYNSISQAARENYISQSTVSKCANGIYKTAGGYEWKVIAL